MNENLAVILGEIQTQIYWLHDAQKFTELATAAANIYTQLGYSQQQSETAGKLISEAYQLADDADRAYQAGDYDKELPFYHEAKDKLIQVENTLNYPNSIAIHQVQWWRYFRHKQKLQIIIHLFLQHLKAVGFVHLFTAIKLTYFLMEISSRTKENDTVLSFVEAGTQCSQAEKTEQMYYINQ